MQTIYADDERGRDEAFRLIHNREEGIIVNYTKKIWCVCGNGNDFREDVCREKGIEVFYAHHPGGTTIVFPGDLSVMEIRAGPSNFADDAFRAIYEALREQGIPVQLSGNDMIMLRRNSSEIVKVGSRGSNWIKDGWMESTVHISVNVDVPLIRAICTKPMVKIPGALGEYGVTAEKLWESAKGVSKLQKYIFNQEER